MDTTLNIQLFSNLTKHNYVALYTARPKQTCSSKTRHSIEGNRNGTPHKPWSQRYAVPRSQRTAGARCRWGIHFASETLRTGIRRLRTVPRWPAPTASLAYRQVEVAAAAAGGGAGDGCCKMSRIVVRSRKSEVPMVDTFHTSAAENKQPTVSIWSSDVQKVK